MVRLQKNESITNLHNNTKNGNNNPFHKKKELIEWKNQKSFILKLWVHILNWFLVIF